MNPDKRSGGLAAWSIRHPVGVSVLALSVVVLGLFTFGRLAVDLLPHIIYPEIRVRVIDPGVPASVVEDRISRRLEEQLAVTEDAIAIQSRSVEGSSSIDLTFPYGKDIDIALRDASSRLDRAKRFLPDTIDPPTIYKRDPSQIPVIEFVVGSTLRDSVELREWVDYDFALQFLNLPGVAAVEVGGGLLREIQVLPDQQRLASLGLSMERLLAVLREGNVEMPGGRLTMTRQEVSSRTTARFRTVREVRELPLTLADGTTIRLDELAEVVDTHQEERLLVRLDGVPGVKVSVQKQPSANTVAVVEAVNQRLHWLETQRLLPEDVSVSRVADQAVYVRNALDSASIAAFSGTLLAMSIVYLFLGNLRRTLIIGSAIPLAVMVTLVLMDAGGLTFNIMSLGGLALGVGMLVDNTIVMLENIYRHQQHGESGEEAGRNAAAEINGAIVASTSTNLAAVLPFLFIGGLVGLLFRELIVTISAAILASMVVALTLVPSLAVRVKVSTQRHKAPMDGLIGWLERRYAALVDALLRHRLPQALLILALLGALAASLPVLLSGKQQFLPTLDDGQILATVVADPGVSVGEMDRTVRRLETLLLAQPEVETVFSTVGGFIFGRSEFQSSNRSSITIQLVARSKRPLTAEEWIRQTQSQIAALEMAGAQVHMRPRGIRGIRLGSGDDDISLRLQGPDLTVLGQLANEVVSRLKQSDELRNVQHSAEELRQELNIEVDRVRAAALGLTPDTVAKGLRRALDGEEATEFMDGDRSHQIKVMLPRQAVDNPQKLEQVLLFAGNDHSLRLGDVANVTLAAAPAEIKRDNQRRVVEVNASVSGDSTIGSANMAIQSLLADLELPAGYVIYDSGGIEALKQGQSMGKSLLGLALFLVFVVMAVQYESLRNPFVILLSVPFAAIGVAGSLVVTGLPLSMPVWLGLIMLAGIVVNNAIILVEYVEIVRKRGATVHEAIVEAARLRLRPILMTTISTLAGMLPLALGWGEGGEMLQPLAVALVGGLGVSLLVTLALIPVVYRLFHREASVH